MSRKRGICHRIYRTTDLLLFLVVCGTLPDHWSNIFCVSRASCLKWQKAEQRREEVAEENVRMMAGHFYSLVALRIWFVVVSLFLDEDEENGLIDRAIWRI